jgi:hypothetical protein
MIERLARSMDRPFLNITEQRIAAVCAVRAR